MQRTWKILSEATDSPSASSTEANHSSSSESNGSSDDSNCSNQTVHSMSTSMVPSPPPVSTHSPSPEAVESPPKEPPPMNYVTTPQLAETTLERLRQRLSYHTASNGSNAESAMRSLELLRITVQSAFDKDVDIVIRRYMELYFRPACNNIKENLGENAISDEMLQKMSCALLENAKDQYNLLRQLKPIQNSDAISVPQEHEILVEQQQQQQQQLQQQQQQHQQQYQQHQQQQQQTSQRATNKRIIATTINESNFPPKRHFSSITTRSQHNANQQQQQQQNQNQNQSHNQNSNSNQIQNNENEKRSTNTTTTTSTTTAAVQSNFQPLQGATVSNNATGRRQIFWNTAHISTATKFVLDVQANQAFGFGTDGRERLASKHPELIRYLPDTEDRNWLISQNIIPQYNRNTRFLFLIYDEVCNLQQTHDFYRNKTTINLSLMRTFFVPEFMIQKMRHFFVDLNIKSRGLITNSFSLIASSTSSTTTSTSTTATTNTSNTNTTQSNSNNNNTSTANSQLRTALLQGQAVHQPLNIFNEDTLMGSASTSNDFVTTTTFNDNATPSGGSGGGGGGSASSTTSNFFQHTKTSALSSTHATLTALLNNTGSSSGASLIPTNSTSSRNLGRNSERISGSTSRK